MRTGRGDVVFAPDPFRPSENPRPWVVLSAESMPFLGDFLCVAVTRSEYAMNYELKDEHWAEGGQPSDAASYCSPWLLNTIKSGQIRFQQGSLTQQFTEKMTRDAVGYLDRASAE